VTNALIIAYLLIWFSLQAAAPLAAQSTTSPSPASATDPGVRGGAPGAGLPLPNLTASERLYFDAGKAAFLEIDAVADGLGPRFNLDSCGGCHAQPATGGTSPAINPQVAVASRLGAGNVIPSFLRADGPVREARFKFKADGSRDGGVQALFTISGRSDAVGCSIAQPNFAAASAANNVIFRVPTPVFGAGLIEAIPDAVILANKQANALAKSNLRISGRENRNGNDGTITRFGWKAQNKSLAIFAGEAYNVEQGVTNELFSDERESTASCQFNGTPEDHTGFDQALTLEISGDVMRFAHFMRFLAPPAPAPPTASTMAGAALFRTIGCALCHTPSLTTGNSSCDSLSNKTVNLYSDLLVHNMGPSLADDIVQGLAGPSEFRTAPLWGLGQRIFFLHDGRTRDLVQAIQAHSSRGNTRFPDSEANAVIEIFNLLPASDKQNLLNFLRSL
jgi:CxxC motif-containing protein (DUF1111 family)